MRALPSGLQDHLDSGATTLCSCWRVTRSDGVALGFTDHDRTLSFDGTVFEPDSGVSGGALSSSADLAVDNAEIEGALASDRLSAEDLAAGLYDGAGVELFRVNWADTDMRLLIKRGVIGEIARAGEAFKAEFRGISHALDQTVGRVYQRLCDVNLGSTPCGVDLDDPAYRAEGAVTSVSDGQRVIVSGLAGFDEGWFANGTIEWTSGENAGVTAHVKSHGAAPGGGGAIALWLPPGKPVAIGDNFVLRAGCDKRFETCRAKFANTLNFRGAPFMPGNDFAISYPLRGETNDGGKR